jgi:putative transposase
MREIRTLRATWRGLETWRVKCFDLSRRARPRPYLRERGAAMPRATRPYIKVHGHWRYLYRAIDRNGALIDVMFSEHRDMAAAMAFFQSAKTVTEVTPDRVTTDGHDSYPRAIRTSLGEAVKHRTSRYLNNRLEQDHRGIKGRYQPMRGFKCPRSAGRFCRGYDELRSLLRSRARPHQHMSANNRRLCFLRRTATVMAILEAA